MAWTGLGLVALIGVGAMAIDMGYMYVLKGQLQTTADAAARAAAKELPNSSAVLAVAQDIAVKNMPTGAHGTVVANSGVELGNWNTTTRTFSAGGNPVNAVRVTARRDGTNSNAASTFFATVLGIQSVDINAQSIAARSAGTGGGCVIALDPSSQTAFDMDGDSVIDLTGCGVQINSSSGSALSLTSRSTMDVENATICINGGYDTSQFATLPHAQPTHCEPIADPLASLPAPNSSGPCDHTNYEVPQNQSQTLNPGVYCGGLRLRSGSSATLNAGLYIVKAGKLRLDSDSSLSGSGVTIFLTGGTGANAAVLDFNASANVQLSAQTQGTYAGVLFYQDRALTGVINTLHSGATLRRYTGAVYLPSNQVDIDATGEVSSGSNCVVFIARRFHFSDAARLTGTYNLGANCPSQLAGALGVTPGATMLVH